MKCPRCGAYIGNNTRFCSQCGNDIGKYGGGRIRAKAAGFSASSTSKTHSGARKKTGGGLKDGARKMADSALESAGSAKGVLLRMVEESDSFKFLASLTGNNYSHEAQDEPSWASQETQNAVQRNIPRAQKAKSTVGMLIAVFIPITIMIIVGIVGFNFYNNTIDNGGSYVYYSDDEQQDEPVYSDSIAALSLDGWSNFYYSDPPLLPSNVGGCFVSRLCDAALYVLGGFNDADNPDIAEKSLALIEQEFTETGARVLLGNAFAELRTKAVGQPWVVGPNQDRLFFLQDGFDFEIAPGSARIAMEPGDVTLYIISCNYSLRERDDNGDFINGSFFLLRTEGSPHYFLMYTVIDRYADPEMARTDVRLSFKPSDLRWADQEVEVAVGDN